MASEALIIPDLPPAPPKMLRATSFIKTIINSPAFESRYVFADPQPNSYGAKQIQMVNNPEFADVEFIFPDNTVVYGHKCIIAPASPVLAAAFNDPFTEAKLGASPSQSEDQGRNKVELQGVSRAEVLELMRCAYADVLRLTVDTLERYFELGIRFEMMSVIACCRWFLERNITVNTAFKHLAIAQRVLKDRATDIVKPFFEQNFADILDSDAFLDASEAMLCELLVSNNFYAPEHKILSRILDWGKKQLAQENIEVSPNVLRGKVSRLLGFVRFGLLTAEDLFAIEQEGILSETELLLAYKVAAIGPDHPSIRDAVASSVLNFTTNDRKDSTSQLTSLMFWDIGTINPNHARLYPDTLTVKYHCSYPNVKGTLIRSCIPIFFNGKLLGGRSRINVRLQFKELHEGGDWITASERGTLITFGLCDSDVTTENFESPSAKVKGLRSNSPVSGALGGGAPSSGSLTPIGSAINLPSSGVTPIAAGEAVDLVIESNSIKYVRSTATYASAGDVFDGTWYLFVYLQRTGDVVQLC